jgi:hypothetical protein
MNIEQNWKRLGEQGDTTLASLLRPGSLSKLNFRHPLEQLKDKLKVSMIIVVLLSCPFIAIMIFYTAWQLELAMGTIVLNSFWVFYTCYRLRRKISLTISAPRSLLDELKQHYNSLRNLMNIQERVSLFIWPLSIVAGKMLGHLIGSSEPLAVYMLKRSSIFELIIFSIVLVPAFYFFTRQLTKIRYGYHMEELKRNIDELIMF